MKSTDEQNLKNQVFIELKRAFTEISEAECILAFNRRDRSKDTGGLPASIAATKEAVYAFRKPFESPSGVYTVDAARELQQTYAIEAARELASDEFLTNLERERDGLNRQIAGEKRKLTEAFNEFNGIPARAEALANEVRALQATIEELGSLDAIFSDAFQMQVNGQSVNADYLTTLGAAIATRPLRLPILQAAIEKAQDKRKKLEQRNRDLAKELKQKAHDF